MKLPESFTRVTPLSKLLAAVFFVSLPFLGFYLGMEYQKRITPNLPESSTPVITRQSNKTTPSDSTADWKTYRNKNYGFEFEYPAELLIEEMPDTVTVYTEKEISVHTMKPDTVVIPNFNLSLKRKPGALEEIIKGYPEGEIKWGSNTYKWYFDGAEGTGYNYFYIQDKSGIWYEFSTYSPGDDLNVDLGDANNSQFWDMKKRGDILAQILSSFKLLDLKQTEIQQSDITKCEVDADCIIVKYSSCCGATKKAINKKYLEEYNTHKEWQSFQDEKTCAVMGICSDDSNVIDALCIDNQCNLKF